MYFIYKKKFGFHILFFYVINKKYIMLRHKPKGIVVMNNIDFVSSACEDILNVSSLSAHTNMTLTLR